MTGKTIDNYEATYEDFATNKEKYIEKGIKNASKAIYPYIENGIIKYDYYTIKMDSLFYQVGKEGCFNW